VTQESLLLPLCEKHSTWGRAGLRCENKCRRRPATCHRSGPSGQAVCQ
jgi:hypothetical protein